MAAIHGGGVRRRLALLGLLLTMSGLALAAPLASVADATIQAPAPGGVQVGDSIYYDGGAVIYTPAAATASLPCPDPYVCLYRDTNWNGDRWIFRDAYWQNLNAYGASDEVSSWSNHENRVATLSWDVGGGGAHLHLSAHAHASSMGSWNDQASAVHP